MNPNFKTKDLFLIDAIGATASALLLGLLLPYFESYVGMPVATLRILAAIAIGFSIYSFTCYLMEPERANRYLTFIAVCNALYSLLTFCLIIYFWADLTIFGVLYFLGEVAVILIIVRLEWKQINKL